VSADQATIAQLQAELAQTKARQELLEREVTWLRHTTAGLQADERRYRELVESANGIILEWDTEGRILFINRFGQNFFGFEDEELIGRNVTGTIVPDTESTGRNLRALMDDITVHPERYYNNENENVTKDGRRVWIVWANRAIVDGDGRLVGIRSIGNDITQRKIAEAEVQASEERLRIFLESSPDAIVSYDINGGVLYVNPAFTETFGWTLDEIAGRRLNFVPEDKMAELWQIRDYAAQHDGRASGFETVRLVKGGKRIDVSVSGALVIDKDGRPGGSFSIIRDISRRKRAEEVLRRQHEYLAALHDMTLGLMTRLDLDDLLSALLARASQLLGAPHGYIYLVDEEAGHMDRKLGVGMFTQRARIRLLPGQGLAGKVWQSGQPLVINDYDHWDGRSPHFDFGVIHAIMGVPLTSGRQVIGVIGLAYDAEDPRTFGDEEVETLNRFAQLASVALDNAQLYATAQREKEYFEALVQISPVAILTVDLEMTIVGWNPAAEKLFGYSRAEAIGRNIDDLIAAGSTHDEAVTFSGQVVEEGRVHAITQRTRKDGSLVDVEMGVVPVVLAGKRHGFIGIYHDISELQRARREAEMANEAKSTFLASVSHELRTPLTSILGFAKIIQKRLDDRILPAVEMPDAKTQRAMQQVQENVHIIVSEGERLTALINDVLDLAKIEAGKVEWQMETLFVADVIERATSATAALFPQKNLKLVKEVPADLPAISGDLNRLIQVLINLISNAVKFTDEGSVTCRARQAGGEVIISVSDTGVGIAPDDLPKIFEKFRQVGDTLTDKPKGTGLGLAICKEIVEKHHGRIWAESRPGEGSVFSLAIPMAESEPNQPARHDNGRIQAMPMDTLVAQLRPHLAAPQAGPKSILIVDDDTSVRKLLRQELESEGYIIHEAADGRQALWQAQQNRPDLIILDVMMPELNGFDVAAVLKNNPQTMRIPIMILSITENQERGYRLGIDRYLTKPIDTDLLLRETENLLAQGASAKKVMVVDENASTVRLLTEALQAKGYMVVQASSGDQALETAVMVQPDMIIMNAVLSQQGNLVRTLRFEKGLDNVLFLLFQ
jgi:PAS domain S-box-containing protein